MGGFAVGRGDLEKEARVLWVRQLKMAFLQKKLLLYVFYRYNEGHFVAVSGAYNDAQRVFLLQQGGI